MPKSAQSFPGKEDLETECGADLTLYECKYCGLIQLEDNPVPYYRDVIRAVAVSSEMMGYRKQQFEEWRDKYNLEDKHILEVGAGRGEFMQIMKSVGINVTGLEHSLESVEYAKKNGLNVINGFLEDENYVVPGGPYDGFYIMSFLEHIPSVSQFIKCIYYNMNANAVGLVEVPNFDMILRESLFSELIQDHLSYFTEDTLKNILSMNGFDVISCKPSWHDYIISAEVVKRKGTDISGFVLQQKRLKEEVTGFLKEEKSKNHKIAVWGAGHQALANLSLLEMKDYIECVIDSAVFKQGKYTPATHIPIVAPDILKSGDIKAVVIMAGSYSEEIVSIMKNQYSGIRFAVLGKEGVACYEN